MRYSLFFLLVICYFFHALFTVFFTCYLLFFSCVICCFFHALFVVFFTCYLLLFSLVICCFFHALFTVFLMKKSMECYIISQLCYIRMYQQYSMGAWGNQETERHWGECQVQESIWELWFHCCQVRQYLRCAWGACRRRRLLSTCGCYAWALHAVRR